MTLLYIIGYLLIALLVFWALYLWEMCSSCEEGAKDCSSLFSFLAIMWPISLPFSIVFAVILSCIDIVSKLISMINFSYINRINAYLVEKCKAFKNRD